MTRELQLRDVEILRIFDALAPGSDNLAALEQETMKQAGCTLARINEAIKSIDSNPEHMYWRT
jgi:hypothetical protein